MRTEPVYEKCVACGSRGELAKDSIWTCDGCGNLIDGDEYLTATTFSITPVTVNHLDLCSWRCLVNVMKKEKPDYFADLPKLNYDVPETSPVHANRFFELLAVQP